MVQLAELNNSFASGEIAPDAWERSDLEQIGTGCELAANFIGRTTGAIVSRGGFYRRGAPKHQGYQQRLFSWNRPDGEALVLELGELYGRVWTAGGAQIETSPGVPYEFAHGYSAADLANLRLKQVGDVGFVTSRYGLLNGVFRRLADNSWTFTLQALRNGPWLAENADASKGLTFTYVAGIQWNVQTVGAWAKFTPQHVGQLLLARAPGGGPGLRTWAPNTAYVTTETLISAGRVYACDLGGTSGNTPPTHEQGAVSDGGVTWSFLHDGATVFEIAAYVSATEVVVNALGAPPFISGTSTPNWSDAAFGPAAGRPTALVAVREERLVMAATPARPDVIEFSRTAGFTPDYADFKPGLGTGLVVDDDACRVQLGDNRARIVWMVDAIPFVAGTTDAEWVVSGGTLEDPISPSGVKSRRVSSHGSADVMPLVVQGPPSLILHVAKGGSTIRELMLGGGGERDAVGRDLSILSQHVFGLGIVDWAMSRPDNNIWIQLASGGLACLTYHYEHGVLGVRQQPMPGGWVVESLCCASDAGGRDRLHVAALRVKAGVGVQRAHFVMADRDRDPMFMDCADTYSGSPTTAVSGLAHLEGEDVWVLGDGALYGPVTVSGGAVSWDTPASNVVVGLPLLRRFKSLAFDPNRDGLGMSRKSRPVAASLVMAGVEAVARSEAQNELDTRVVPFERILQRRPTDTVPVVRRHRARITLGGGADSDTRVIVETDKPYDLQLFALRPVYETPR